MKQLRIGLIGASRVATYAMLAPARVSPRAVVTAVAARGLERAEAFAAAHGVPRAFGDYRALIESGDIDVAYIGTPPFNHAALALQAIDAGLAVLVEKPFAMNAGEAENVRKAAAAAGVPVFEAMHSRHHALHARVAAIVAGGEIGEIESTRALFQIPRPPAGDFRYDVALGGGALMDLGIYPLAWTRALLGENWRVGDANARRENGVDIETRATLQFGSVACDVVAGMDAAGPDARFVVQGTRGKLEVVNPLAPQLGHALSIETPDGVRRESVEGPGTYDAQLGALCATLLDGALWPLPEDDFVQSMRAIDAVRAASGG